ncbi:MAG: hypothetical protein D6708_13310 [Candidatus Dadabacteria bacterium]|nr:MAG: hypothetical protein D6708_13310 [Candidatus Dadabacteria bacterium]
MEMAHLVGFDAEGSVRLAAFLLRWRVIAVPLRPAALPGEGAGLVLLNAGARELAWTLVGAMADPEPGARVIALFPVQAFPVWDAGLFPRWVRCVAFDRLEEVLRQEYGPPAGTPPRPHAALWAPDDGLVQVVAAEVAGPAGAVLRAPLEPRPGGRGWVVLRRGPARVRLAGTVGARRPAAAGWRVVVRFAEVTPPVLERLVEIVAA